MSKCLQVDLMTNLFCVCNKSYDSINHKKSEQYIIKTDEVRGRGTRGGVRGL